MDAALQAMLTDQVTYQRYVSQDGYGAPTFATGIVLPARIEYKLRRIVNAQGEERMSRAKVFLDGAIPLDLRDKLVLPDGTAPALQLVYAVNDERGSPHHTEGFF